MVKTSSFKKLLNGFSEFINRDLGKYGEDYIKEGSLYIFEFLGLKIKVVEDLADKVYIEININNADDAEKTRILNDFIKFAAENFTKKDMIIKFNGDERMRITETTSNMFTYSICENEKFVVLGNSNKERFEKQRIYNLKILEYINQIKKIAPDFRVERPYYYMPYFVDNFFFNFKWGLEEYEAVVYRGNGEMCLRVSPKDFVFNFEGAIEKFHEGLLNGITNRIYEKANKEQFVEALCNKILKTSRGTKTSEYVKMNNLISEMYNDFSVEEVKESYKFVLSQNEFREAVINEYSIYNFVDKEKECWLLINNMAKDFSMDRRFESELAYQNYMYGMLTRNVYRGG